MDRKQAKKLAPIITAFGDGKEIQYYYTTKWIEIERLSFIEPIGKYRIKPEPRVLYVNDYWGKLSGANWDTRQEAENSADGTCCKPTKFIEDLP